MRLVDRCLLKLSEHHRYSPIELDEIKKDLFHSVPHKLRILKDSGGAFYDVYSKLSKDPFDSYCTMIWQNMAFFPSGSLVLQLVEELTLTSIENIKSDVKTARKLYKQNKPLMDIFLEAPEKNKISIDKLVPGKNNWYIVSIDLMNSTKLKDSGDERWLKVREYFIHIMHSWGKHLGSRFISSPGDELIVGFLNYTNAITFAAGCSVHILELSESINNLKTFQYEVGCRAKISYGEITLDVNRIHESAAINHLAKNHGENKRIFIHSSCDGRSHIINDTAGHKEDGINRLLVPQDEFIKYLLNREYISLSIN